VALLSLGIDPTSVKTLGLRKIKEQAKKRFRQRAHQKHPDLMRLRQIQTRGYPTINLRYTAGRGFQQLKKRYEKIQSLKYLPLSYEDPEFDRILDLKREYQTTADVDFGLNSHLAEMNGYK